MSRYNRRSQGALFILAVILFVILLFGIAGGLFSGGVDAEDGILGGVSGDVLDAVSVYFNGTKVKDGGRMSLRSDVPIHFDVKNVLGLAAKDYSVSVIPYCDTNSSFNYLVDGSTYTWDEHITGDLSKKFRLVVREGYFIFGINEYTMLDYLQYLHPQEEVSLASSPDMSQNEYFAIRISSGDSVSIFPFRIISGSSESGSSTNT